MLVLSRKLGQEILIGDNIRVTVLEVKKGRVRLGVAAPEDVHILRKELEGQKRTVAKPISAVSFPQAMCSQT
jgi:carbon storage regulator